MPLSACIVKDALMIPSNLGERIVPFIMEYLCRPPIGCAAALAALRI